MTTIIGNLMPTNESSFKTGDIARMTDQLTDTLNYTEGLLNKTEPDVQESSIGWFNNQSSKLNELSRKLRLALTLIQKKEAENGNKDSE